MNGVAENAIKIVVSKARTMMVHCSLHWPDECDVSHWPMAMSYAARLHCHTPNRESKKAPAEIFCQSKSNYEVLRNAHVWGCPVYVLQPKLSNGGKIPKWDPRCRLGQFMGTSPDYSETVPMVRNVRTGRITCQFNVVVDEMFETVSSHSSKDKPPPSWEDLCIYQRFWTEFDEGVTPPPLQEEWLTPEERKHHKTLRSGRPLSQHSDEPKPSGPRESAPSRPREAPVPAPASHDPPLVCRRVSYRH